MTRRQADQGMDRRRFVERFERLTDDDVRRLAEWTAALKGDQPAPGREWRHAVSVEFNSWRPHPAAQAYTAAVDAVRDLLERDEAAARAYQELGWSWPTTPECSL